MTSGGSKPNRSLERGLRVYSELQRRGAASLAELHEATGLPKATLLRLLTTLRDQGFAARRIADDLWVAGARASLRHNRATDQLSQIAAPILDDLCRRIIWPSDLSVRAGIRMVLRETSRAHSTLMLNRLRIGFQINMLMSAPGRAYLAFCPDAERGDILDRLRASSRAGCERARDESYVAAMLQQTHALGYGLRDPLWGGDISRPITEYDDGLNAIAVPIMKDAAVLGCINIVWIRSLLRHEEISRRYLADLINAATAISSHF